MGSDVGRVRVAPARTAETVLRRCCGAACACEHDEQPAMLRRDSIAAGPAVAPPIVHQVLASPGESLDAAARAEFEERFGRDFSTVRVHSDARAAASASVVGARAYTVGSDIAFAAGHYAPGTSAGRRLLAHELTHVAQSGPRAVAPPPATLRMGATDAHEEHEAARVAGDIGGLPRPVTQERMPVVRCDRGTAVVEDSSMMTSRLGRKAEGTMRRTWFSSPADAAAAKRGGKVASRSSTAKVAFDGDRCTVTIPVTVRVRAAVPGDLSPSMDADLVKKPPKAADSGVVKSVGAAYIAACNVRLNGWYEAIIRDCGKEPCADKPMPIRVVVAENSAATPDFDICVTEQDRRSYVDRSPAGGGPDRVVLHSRGLQRNTLAHEGYHMALGAFDEYVEPDDAVRKQSPGTTGPEREYDDWSLGASSALNEPLLYERHFSFVAAFLRDIMTQMGHPCRVELRAVQQPKPLNLRLDVGLGGSDYGGGAMRLDLGFGVGLPLDARRRWQAFVSAHAATMLPLDINGRYAFLAGARFGIEHQARPVAGGVEARVFGDIGATTEFGRVGTPTTPARSLAPLVGAGARLGYQIDPKVSFGLEGSLGVRADSEFAKFYSLGLYLGVQFR